ncbi:MAG: hypothetical protein DSM106950_18870 [Stigonema ocellatum SAG 48.90 = DSM 106950]|nr:hypothetical protein [Stigonema ocellatum SAG 48.90 = DSM 106950]
MNKSKKQAGIQLYSNSRYENDWLTGVSSPLLWLFVTIPGVEPTNNDGTREQFVRL